jgi:UbiA prenyltransferase family
MNSTRQLLLGTVELLRPPNVFTAVADALAGLALAFGGLAATPSRGFWLVPASAALYLGGMALNDYCDRATDARERPERPIPSGRVPAAFAAALAAALLAVGVAFARAAGALGIALALAAAIVAYDAALKGTPIGFINMGMCRGLNLSMALAIAPRIAPVAIAAATFLTAYVAVLTYLSRDEVGGNTPLRARRAVGALAILAALVATSLSGTSSPFFGGLFFFAVLVRGSSLFAPLWTHADGPATGRAIGGGILLIPLVDATFVAASGYVPSAIVVASFALPAIGLRRLYSPT